MSSQYVSGNYMSAGYVVLRQFAFSGSILNPDYINESLDMLNIFNNSIVSWFNKYRLSWKSNVTHCRSDSALLVFWVF